MITELEATELSHVAGGVIEAPDGTGCGQTTPIYHVNPDGTRGEPIDPILGGTGMVPVTSVSAV